MKRLARPAELSPAQLQIMNLVWEHGEMGVAQVWEALSRQRPVARNTVQTMLGRLAKKGWLRHRQEQNAFYYSAARPRRRTIDGMLRRLVQAAFGGSTSGLVLTLLEDASLSDDDADRIRAMIDRAKATRDKSKTPKEKRGSQ